MKQKPYIEVKVHFIHKKQVPLLHNTVLILCYEGNGLVGLTEFHFEYASGAEQETDHR